MSIWAPDRVFFLSAEGLVGGFVRDIQAPRANYNARFYGSSSKCWLVKLLLFPSKLYLAGSLERVIVSLQSVSVDLFVLSSHRQMWLIFSFCLSSDPTRFQDTWRLSDGFVAAEAKVVLPHRARSRCVMMQTKAN